jgi:hypothetical protein
MLIVQGNLANTYQLLRRDEEALHLRRDVYSRIVKLKGEEHEDTLREAICYASNLIDTQRHAEAKSLMRKTVPKARRVFGETHEHTLTMRTNYARALHTDPDATLDDLCEAMETLEVLERTAQRILGGPHPLTVQIELSLQDTRAARAALLRSNS